MPKSYRVIFLICVLVLTAGGYFFYAQNNYKNFTKEQTNQFINLAQEHEEAYQAIAMILEEDFHIQITNPQVQRNIHKRDVLPLYQLVFALFNFKYAPLVDGDGQLDFPGYNNFQYLVAACKEATQHVHIVQSLAYGFPQVSSFCNQVSAIDRVFITGLTEEEIFSLNSWALESSIPPEIFAQIKAGDFGTKYQEPSLERLIKLPVFGKYVIK
ncbi:hypothetical protein CKF54_05020 [Psittacicella hinzii]|uniref:Uncharacterized protein n=1 Tax=Psittacicella hinzii TaxID=2028575 RepID=A0A3A1Y4Z2_9GAMM|nr:hypothetical protein [Psittacicella hinzii]RIY32359.1 hypothetical protein CKF54_05020 [Psittacicella hinzii]